MTKFLRVVVLAGIPVLAASASDPSVLVKDTTTLRFITGPTNADTVLRSFLRTKGPTLITTGMPNWDNLKIMPPFPRYQLARTAVWDGDSLNKATRDGYLYRVLQNDRECITAIIYKISGSDDANPENILLEFGKVDPLTSVLDRYTDSLATLSELEQVRGGLYETRLLLLPPRSSLEQFRSYYPLLA